MESLPSVSPSSGAPPTPPPPPTTPPADDLRSLRAEVDATSDPSRRARLLTEIGEIEERRGDDSAAARDYLAALEADSAFRESLEGLGRLLQRSSTLTGLGDRFFDALHSTAATADERVRALLLEAAQRARAQDGSRDAERLVERAVAIEDASPAERARVWLELEVIAGRTGNAAARAEALAERARFAAHPTWHGLLLVDRARMAADAGHTDDALAILDEACALGAAATWEAATTLERIARERPGIVGTAEARSRSALHASALEAVAAVVREAVVDGTRGDALGVPGWARDPARAVDAWLRAGELRRELGELEAAATVLEKAAALLEANDGPGLHLSRAALERARIRVADAAGNRTESARIAQALSADADVGPLAAALALRVVEDAVERGRVDEALVAAERAVRADPGSLAAAATLLDRLADAGPTPALAARLEAFAEDLSTDAGRARAYLLAAYVWATGPRDVEAAKSALAHAAMFGTPPDMAARVGRALASLAEDPAWYEDATKRLLACAPGDGEAVWLQAEIVRLRAARGDLAGAEKAIRDLGEIPGGAWMARVLQAFPPAWVDGGPAGRIATTSTVARTAVDALAAEEADPELARVLRFIAALRALAAGDADAARTQLRVVAETRPDEVLTATLLAELERRAGDHGAASRAAAALAASTPDAELAAAAHVEAALEAWRAGDRKAAIERLEGAGDLGADAAAKLLRWAVWAVDAESRDARRHAVIQAERAGSDPRVCALERFAIEVAEGDPDAAAEALASLERSPSGSLSLAAALARIAWPGGREPATAMADALSRIAARGPRALLVAAAERVRLAVESDDREARARAAAAWHEAGGGLPAALEWLAAAVGLGDVREELRARRALADVLPGDARESMLAGLALLQTHVDLEVPAPLVAGRSPAVRLANLELAPPGSDPRRRALALEDVGRDLGDEARIDALALAGWSRFASSDLAGARQCFETVTAARPQDLASWEGLRACAERLGDGALLTTAAAELGARCADAARGAAFWEEAALVALSRGDEEAADIALEASFARDATRSVAFDKLFRRVRERKDNEKLLALVARRLEVTDEPAEIQKLYWERARVLREKGDHTGALESLEHVTILDPDHVGALALLGEINIRRGQYEDAASALERLATLDAAPPKNRVTAGVAAADLYENKLGQLDKALGVLSSLHAAKLSTVPVRERLARIAARASSWVTATAVLEELMHERTERAGRIEAARLAMAIRRDRLSEPQSAEAAVTQLLEDAPTDPEAIDWLLQAKPTSRSIRALLERTRGALAARAQESPTDPTTIRYLALVARALNDGTLEQSALGVLGALGANEGRLEQAFAQLIARKPRTPHVSLSPAMLRSVLAPGDEGPIAELFALLGPTIAEALGPNAQVCGVTKRDRIDPRSGLALRNEIAAWAGAIGIGEFDLYVGGKDPLGVQAIAGDPPALVVGAGVNAPLSPLTRARVARELFAALRGTTIARARDEVSVAAVVVAACHIADVAIEHPPYAVLAEFEKLLGRAIARRTRKAIAGPCARIAAGQLDARAWTRRALASQDRMAAVASGDPSVVLSDVLGTPLDRLAQAVPGSARALDLLRYVLSAGYAEVRGALGLEGGA